MLFSILYCTKFRNVRKTEGKNEKNLVERLDVQPNEKT